MKSGTTSLYHYLRAHPQIGMSVVKETDFFIEREDRSRGGSRDERQYRSLFGDGHRAAGEVSPNYTKRHLFPGVPARMKALVPDAKLIYLLRDPVARAVSHYTGSYALGREKRRPAEMVDTLPESNYVLTSRYAYQLDAYRECFARERFLFVSSRALRRNRRRTLRRIYRFVGVEERFHDADAAARVLNESSAQGQLPAWLRTATSGPLLQRLKDRLRPHLPAWMAPRSPHARPEIGEDFRQRLAAYLREDAQRLRAQTGRDFSHWRC